MGVDYSVIVCIGYRIPAKNFVQRSQNEIISGCDHNLNPSIKDLGLYCPICGHEFSKMNEGVEKYISIWENDDEWEDSYPVEFLNEKLNKHGLHVLQLLSNCELEDEEEDLIITLEEGWVEAGEGEFGITTLQLIDESKLKSSVLKSPIIKDLVDLNSFGVYILQSIY